MLLHEGLLALLIEIIHSSFANFETLRRRSRLANRTWNKNKTWNGAITKIKNLSSQCSHVKIGLELGRHKQLSGRWLIAFSSDRNNNSCWVFRSDNFLRDVVCYFFPYRDFLFAPLNFHVILLVWFSCVYWQGLGAKVTHKRIHEKLFEKFYQSPTSESYS